MALKWEQRFGILKIDRAIDGEFAHGTGIADRFDLTPLWSRLE